MRKWAAHRDSVTPHEKFHKVPFTQNFQFFDFSCYVFPEIMHFDDSPNKNHFFPQESSNNVILLGVGFGVFYGIVIYLQKMT